VSELEKIRKRLNDLRGKVLDVKHALERIMLDLEETIDEMMAILIKAERDIKLDGSFSKVAIATKILFSHDS